MDDRGQMQIITFKMVFQWWIGLHLEDVVNKIFFFSSGSMEYPVDDEDHLEGVIEESSLILYKNQGVGEEEVLWKKQNSGHILILTSSSIQNV